MESFWAFLLTVYQILAIYFVAKFLATVIISLAATIYIHWIFNKLFKPIDLVKRFGKWAVVTGCTEGIGKHYSKELAARKMNVVLISRNADKLEALAKEIEMESGVKTAVVVADFSGGEDVYNKIEDQIKDLDIGILVNNVGIVNRKPMPVEEMTAQELWNLVLVNVGAATAMTHLILPGMKRRRRGAIINITSLLGRGPIPYFSLYGATKAYLKSFSDALRVECQGTGVEVQTLSPSFVNTHHSAVWCADGETASEGFFVPSPQIFVKHAVATIGVAQNTSGYWPHELQYEFFRFGDDWIWANAFTRSLPVPPLKIENLAGESELETEISGEKSHSE